MKSTSVSIDPVSDKRFQLMGLLGDETQVRRRAEQALRALMTRIAKR